MIECPLERMRKMSRTARYAMARRYQGTKHHKAKLSADDVRAIRARLAAGEKNYRIADAFGVWPDAISRIKRGLSYRDVM